MDRLGPFEAAPRLAVGVSGGPDSLALALLAASWARRRGGEVTGLTVDHRLRTGSDREAALVGRWLGAGGIPHRALPWTGRKPATAVQASAREARHRLLTAWCRDAGVLHLLLAHHLDDQLETIAHRAARGSGPDGLAGMPAIREVRGLRLLRPLLDVPKAALRRWLVDIGQDWLEDPTNRDTRFARGALRASGRVLHLPDAARGAAHRRQRDECELAAWLARHARVDPLGCVTVTRRPFARADRRLRHGVLRAAITCVGGRAYPPSTAGLARLDEALEGRPERPRTLGGTRLIPLGEVLLVAREAAAIPAAPSPLVHGLVFDGRYRIELPTAPCPPGLTVAPLGGSGWRRRRRLEQRRPSPPVRQEVAEALPAVYGAQGLVAVPQLGLVDPGYAALEAVAVRFRPRNALGGAPFADPGAMVSFASALR